MSTNMRRGSTKPLITAEDYHDSVKQCSMVGDGRTHTWLLDALPSNITRRFSMDPDASQTRQYVIPVQATLRDLLSREDTDSNHQITIDDTGPKVLTLGTLGSHGYNHHDIRGTYMLSNLLQELTLAHEVGDREIVLDESKLSENCVQRLSRLVRTRFWTNLTRRLDASSIEMAGADPKDWTIDPRRIYIPEVCAEQIRYYTEIAASQPELRLDVRILTPHDLTAEGIRDLNAAPGLLALAMKNEVRNGKETLQGLPFVVPDGRFNEMYGWDSYMESIGLLLDARVDLVDAMVKNFCFSIKHYGKILNANRTYYLGRSQPPFLTDMALRVFDFKIAQGASSHSAAKEDLREAMSAAIKEYYTIWIAAPRFDTLTGLSRYRPYGIGVPPETESTHFTHIITPFAVKLGMSAGDYIEAYNAQRITEPTLDEYFLHDRAVRESGHDTSYRLEKVAANLATIDLNALLYKYEMDIAQTIKTHFNHQLYLHDGYISKAAGMNSLETSEIWFDRADARKRAVHTHLWSDSNGMFFDYDTVKREQKTYESATMFWALWSGLATPAQAAAIVSKALPRLEAFGGLVSGTEDSRGPISIDRPARQWDYPFGWAPQQMLAWIGLLRYGYEEEARRLAYRWLYMVTMAFVDFNGVVVEKYDVTRPNDPHKVDAEYGNQGSDFDGVAREGFGWVNASYQLGLSILTQHMRRALGACTPWETFAQAIEKRKVVI